MEQVFQNKEKIIAFLKVMKNFFFKECSVKREPLVVDGKFSTDLQKSIKKTDSHKYEVTLQLMIDKVDFHLFVIACADFFYDAESCANEEYVINNNTIAIMFPFIRSQVSLLTTQPGMVPIVLPPINTAKFK